MQLLSTYVYSVISGLNVEVTLNYNVEREINRIYTLFKLLSLRSYQTYLVLTILCLLLLPPNLLLQTPPHRIQMARDRYK